MPTRAEPGSTEASMGLQTWEAGPALWRGQPQGFDTRGWLFGGPQSPAVGSKLDFAAREELSGGGRV